MGNNSCCFRKESSLKENFFITPVLSKNPSSQNLKYYLEEEVTNRNFNTFQNNNAQIQFAEPLYFSQLQQLNLQKLQQQQIERMKKQEQNKKSQEWEVNPQERLLIATSYLIQGYCEGLKNLIPIMDKLRKIIETKQDYCFFNPEKLSQYFNLIEMQGPTPYENQEEIIQIEDDGCQKKQDSFSNMFWQQMEYFYDDEILQEEEDFQIVAILNLDNNQKYPLAIQKKFDSDLDNYVYIVHDIEKSGAQNNNVNKNSVLVSDNENVNQEQIMGGYNCKEIVFVNKEKFNNYLDIYGNYFQVLQQQKQQQQNKKTDIFQQQNQNNYYNCKDNKNNNQIGIQLINFQYIYNKSSSNYSVQEDDIEDSIESIEEQINCNQINNKINNDIINNSGTEINQRPSLSTNDNVWQ